VLIFKNELHSKVSAGLVALYTVFFFRIPFENVLHRLISGQVAVQNGKVNFTVARPNFSYCTTVQYPRAFSSSRNVRVLATINHGKVSSNVHDSAVVWTSDVTQSSFRACVLESGLGTNGSAIVDWIAFQSTPSGMFDGAASFSTFTSGTKCERVSFAQVI